MSAAVVEEALARYLDVDVAADKWDEQPSLALIIQDAEGGVDFAPVPLGGEVWAAAEPHRVILAAGKTAVAMRRIVDWSPFEDGDTLLGLVLFSEGWGLVSSITESDAMREYTANHRISEHPDRIEVKMVSAVLADDTMVVMTHARGGVTESKPYTSVEGRIPDALRAALADFQEASA